MAIIWLFGFALILAALHVPVVSAMLTGALVYMSIDDTFPVAIIAQRIAPSLDSFPLLAVPLFILAGSLLNLSGVAPRIFNFAQALFSNVKGGLAYVTVLTNIVFAGMSGVATADAAALGLIQVRAMKRQGYDVAFSAALNATAAIIGPIIPPSVIMVVYGVLAGVSVADLFLAGFVPGLMLGGALMVTIYIMSRRGSVAMPPKAKFSMSLLGTSFVHAIPGLMAPAILIAGLILGIATPTELGTITVVYALLLGIVYREITFRSLIEALKSTVITTGVILFIVAAAAPFAWLIAVKGVPGELAHWLKSVSDKPWMILFIINAGLLVAGCFLETTAIMIIAVPALFPIITQLGIDPVHFGLILVFNLLIGTLTPPFGVLIFIMMDITKLGMMAIVRALLPFYITLFVMLALVTYVPTISLFVPKTVNEIFTNVRN